MGNISVVSAGLLERLPWSVIAYPEEMRKDAEHVYVSIAEGKGNVDVVLGVGQGQGLQNKSSFEEFNLSCFTLATLSL